ncbi:MAG: glycosyltransferase family 2 protein [Crocinitomicaceae bacterium]
MDISVVVPLFNEEESLPELHAWIKRVMKENKFTYEVIFVNDGSTDGSWKMIENLCEVESEVRGIKFQRNYGKSAALHVGFQATNGKVVITMDADLQDSPDEIPELYKMIKEDGFDLVSGWKKKRYDPLSKTIPTKIYNGVNRMMSGIKLHDMNCGLKAYRGEVVKSIEVFGEMHRYIPVIAKAAGFGKIGEKVVQHQERKYGKTKFGMNRFVNGFLDMFTITFITRFGKKPMHFFGLWGTILFLLGFCFALYLGIDKLFFDVSGRLIAERPEFYVALTSIIIGTQLFLSGFIAELIGRNSTTRNNYLIEKEI